MTGSVRWTGPDQRHAHAVVACCDANYAPYAKVLFDRLAALHPDRAFDLCLLLTGEAEPPQDTGVRAITLETDSPFQGGAHPSRHGNAAYLRLLLPDVLQDYDRLLYLDTDILPLVSGVSGLLSVDLQGAALGAVRDNTQWRTPERRLPEFRARGFPAAPYFNSGVLLLDTAAWRTGGLSDRCQALWSEAPEVLTRHDQSLLNLVLYRDWAELSPVWNWQYTHRSRYFLDDADPRFVHFIGPGKPWKRNAKHLPLRFRRPYGVPETEAAVLPANTGKMLVRHFRAAGRMARYLARFPDPLTVHRHRPV